MPGFQLLRSFLRSRDGNFGLLSALMMVPLIGIVGIAVDISNALQTKSQIEQAADAAALDGIANADEKLLPNSALATSGAMRQDMERLKQFFLAQLSSTESAGTRLEVDPDTAVSQQVVTAGANYRVAVPSTFLKILGIPQVNVAGSVKATSAIFPYSQIHVLVDNSPTMGVATSQEDQDRLVAATGCEQTCHSRDEPRDTLALARTAGIPLRIDMVREAVGTLGNLVESKRQIQNQFVMNLYSLGETSDNHHAHPVTPVGVGMTDMDQFRARASSIDLMWMSSSSELLMATDLPATLREMDRLIPMAGSGSSPTNPAQILMVISDGIAHDRKWPYCLGAASGLICIEPLDDRDCQALKDKGVRIAVIKTPFPIMRNSNRYLGFIHRLRDDITENMQACASPGLYAEMSSAIDPARLLQKMFLKAVLTPRLTQ